MQKKQPRNPVCAILWMDAAYSTERKLPNELPLPQLTTGFVISANRDFVNVATNVGYDRATRTLKLIDGFIIPKKAILKFNKLTYLDEKI